MGAKREIDAGLAILKAFTGFLPPQIATPVKDIIPAAGALLGLFLKETESQETKTIESIKTELDYVKKSIETVSTEITKLRIYVETMQSIISSKIDELLKRVSKLEISNMRTEIGERMTTIGYHLDSIESQFSRYMEILAIESYQQRKVLSADLVSIVHASDLPSTLRYLHHQLVGSGGGSQTPLLTLYREILRGTQPFQHNIVSPHQRFLDHMIGLQIKAIILYGECCTYLDLRKGGDSFAERFRMEHKALMSNLERQQEFVPKSCLFKTASRPDGTIVIDPDQYPDPANPEFGRDDAVNTNTYAILSNLDNTGLLVDLATTEKTWDTYPKPRRPGSHVHNWTYIDSLIIHNQAALEKARDWFAQSQDKASFVDTYIRAYCAAPPPRKSYQKLVLRDGG